MTECTNDACNNIKMVPVPESARFLQSVFPPQMSDEREPIERGRSRPTTGFTLIELLAAIAIIGVLAVLVLSATSLGIKMAKNVKCVGNLRQLVTGDLLYRSEYGQLPPMDGMVPSTITAQHLNAIAKFVNGPVPPGPVASWPKRKRQPDWYNCPMAKDSGYAEGVTMGGGVYTGYLYVGSISDSQLVKTGMATLLNPEHSADKLMLHRGVVWADDLGEFLTAEPRRFECFHTSPKKRYPDFCFFKSEIDGIHRAWSDGSVEWVPASELSVGSEGSQDLQIRFILGNYYY